MTISATAQTNLPLVAEAVEGVSSELQDANQAAYEQVLAQIEALQAQYEEAKEDILEVNSEFDFEAGGWNEIGVMLAQAKDGAAQALESANEDGEPYQFVYGAEDIEAYIAEMKKIAFADYNQKAYDEVMYAINDVEEQYGKAVTTLQDQYPTINLSEWSDIILGQLKEAITGANQALAASNEYGEKFNFPFDAEYFEGMIAEMQKSAPNLVKYDELMAQIDAVNAQYKEVVAVLENEYPGINLSEWSEIIYDQLDQARTGAKQALDAAIEEGEEFNFAFSTEEIEATIAQMEKSAPNQYAYQNVMAQIDAVEADYESAKAEIAEADPEFDFAEWNEIIGGQLAQAKTGAEQELANVNEEGGEFTFAFDAEDYQGMIAEMKKAGFENYNQTAYEEVLAQINAVEAEYNEAVAGIEESNPDFDFAQWQEIIAPQIADAKTGAEQALAAASEDGVKYSFAFGAKDIEDMITEMKYAAYPYLKAYDEVMAQINAVEAEYDEAKVEIIEVNPDFDFSDWDEIIGVQIADAKTGAEQALENVKDGEEKEFTFAFGAEDIENSIAMMKKTGFADYNQAAYDKVLAEINDVEAEYEDAKVEIAEVNPDFDFEAEEWAELGKQIAEAKKGAEQAYEAANDYGEKYSFAFGAEDIENFIVEMKKVGFAAYNNAAYEEVATQLNTLWTQYVEAKAEILEVNPEFDFSEWDEIGTQIGQAMDGAKQANEACREDGEKFFFPYSTADIEGYIVEMKKAGFEDYNQAAYNDVVNQIENVMAYYDSAVARIEVSYPEFDLSEWKQIIGSQIDDIRTGAKQAYEVATEDGEKFFFPFDSEEYLAMIDQMYKDAEDFSGIANIEAEVAAGNAKIYTLDGKAHFAPVRGQVNVIVRGNSTIKVMIK